jgi:hypothetical protein
MPTALDNGQRSPRKLLAAVVARLLGRKPSRLGAPVESELVPCYVPPSSNAPAALSRAQKGGSMTRRGVSWLAGVVVLAALFTPWAVAAQPTMERLDIDESFPDEFLTEACGVQVTTHAEGHIIVRTFDGEGTGPAELTTISIGLTASADGNSYRFRDVGADLVRIEPDGTAILMITGQVPFSFTGVLKIDLETGEAILEPQHSLEEELDEACEVLTG